MRLGSNQCRCASPQSSTVATMRWTCATAPARHGMPLARGSLGLMVIHRLTACCVTSVDHGGQRWRVMAATCHPVGGTGHALSVAGRIASALTTRTGAGRGFAPTAIRKAVAGWRCWPGSSASRRMRRRWSYWERLGAHSRLSVSSSRATQQRRKPRRQQRRQPTHGGWWTAP